MAENELSDGELNSVKRRKNDVKKCTMLLVFKMGENDSVPKTVRENVEYDNYSCQNKRV